MGLVYRLGSGGIEGFRGVSAGFVVTAQIALLNRAARIAVVASTSTDPVDALSLAMSFSGQSTSMPRSAKEPPISGQSAYSMLDSGCRSSRGQRRPFSSPLGSD